MFGVEAKYLRGKTRLLIRLNRELNRFVAPRMVLIQYVPHAFGWRALNIPFVAWVATRAWDGDEVRVMFHEVAYPWVARPIRHNILAAGNRAMAAILLWSCSRAYVSIPAWIPLLRRLDSRRVPIAWTPVPSNVPDEPGILARRSQASMVVGHFGTYSSPITRMLSVILRTLLNQRPQLQILLLGAGGDRWRLALIAERPDWAGRIAAPGAQPGPAVRDQLRSCDCLVQPYPDGVSTRRGTIMAALANAVPVVTNLGPLSEPFWADGPVVVAPLNDVVRMVELTLNLLDSPDQRQRLSQAGRILYEDRFAITHTVAALLAPTEDPRSGGSLP